jgi:hypothetical protein
MALAGVAVAILGPFAPTAVAAPHSPRPAPGRASSAAFTVPGSNGFSLDVESRPGAVRVVAFERRPPVATFSPGGAPRPPAAGNGAASIYRVRAAGRDPRRVDVRLGQLGRIAVSFHPSGERRVTTLGPGAGAGCGGPVRIVRRLGTFRGTVEFRGENGYTSVRTTSARGSVGTPLPPGCEAATLSRSGRPRPLAGAVLSAADPLAGAHFEARTSGASAVFTARWRERLADGVTVTRRAYAGAPSRAFEFGRGLTWARVAPPAPFTGAAHFAAGAGWRGSLRATFPGGAIPLTGPGFRVSLGAAR